MQVTVSFAFSLPASANLDSLELIIVHAGRRAMVAALQAACREYEAVVSECPHCASTLLQDEGQRPTGGAVQFWAGGALSLIHI